jgi:stearoyl-CoA desaturase (delta-9 desaturase)
VTANRILHDAAAGAFILALYWFMLTTYVSVCLHRAVAHRAFSLPRWFILSVTTLTNLFIIYVNPRVWVAEHRLHHAHSDDPDDPDKHPDHTFWRWVHYLAVHQPIGTDPRIVQVSRDRIFEHPIMRFFSNRFGRPVSEVTGFLIPWLLYRTIPGTVIAWFSIRFAGLTVKAIQSYFAHSSHRGWGYRNYEIPDRSCNIKHPIASFLTAGESLQNNHHAKPTLPIHAHRPDEWDAGFVVVRLLDRLRLVSMPAGRRAEMYSPKVSGLVKEHAIEDPRKQAALAADEPAQAAR